MRRAAKGTVRALSLAASAAIFLLVLVYPLNDANATFNFLLNSQYGAGADNQVTTGGGSAYIISSDKHGGDGVTVATASSSGSDSITNAGSGSSSGSADAVHQKLGMSASVSCSSACSNQSATLLAMDAFGEGVFYDTYTVHCSGCNTGTDLEIAWTIDGTFGSVLSRPDSFVSMGISFSGLTAGGGVVQGNCFLDPSGNIYDCPPTIMNADPSAHPPYVGCSEAGVVCTGSTSFSVSGTAQLSSLLNHYGIAIGNGDSYKIIFDMSGHVGTANPGATATVDASHTGTVTVFSNSPGVTIVSAAQQNSTSSSSSSTSSSSSSTSSSSSSTSRSTSASTSTSSSSSSITTSTTTSTTTTGSTKVPEFPSSAALLIAATALFPLILILRGRTGKSSRKQT